MLSSTRSDALGPHLDRFVGTWRGGAVEGREPFLKAMELNWVLRQIAKFMPNFDICFFRDPETGHLRSHSKQFGKVVEETYLEGGETVKSFHGIATRCTFSWKGGVLHYSIRNDGAPEEEATTKRWVEDDGKTMRAESYFRKGPHREWAVLKRTWHLDESAEQGKLRHTSSQTKCVSSRSSSWLS